MFTGIIEDIGKVISFDGKKLIFLTRLNDINLGDSIAVNGICLTVVEKKQLNPELNKISVEVSKETIHRTNILSLKKSTEINLERALKLFSRIGGHIVSGHIDAKVKVTNIKKETSYEKNLILSVELPKNLSKYIVEKGSVALDGISLTVSNISKNNFSVVLIPHTLKNTTLKNKKSGDILNLEVDILAKYVENINNKNVSYKDTTLLKKLKENGFF